MVDRHKVNVSHRIALFGGASHHILSGIHRRLLYDGAIRHMMPAAALRTAFGDEATHRITSVTCRNVFYREAVHHIMSVGHQMAGPMTEKDHPETEGTHQRNPSSNSTVLYHEVCRRRLRIRRRLVRAAPYLMHQGTLGCRLRLICFGHLTAPARVFHGVANHRRSTARHQMARGAPLAAGPEQRCDEAARHKVISGHRRQVWIACLAEDNDVAARRTTTPGHRPIRYLCAVADHHIMNMFRRTGNSLPRHNDNAATLLGNHSEHGLRNVT